MAVGPKAKCDSLLYGVSLVIRSIVFDFVGLTLFILLQVHKPRLEALLLSILDCSSKVALKNIGETLGVTRNYSIIPKYIDFDPIEINFRLSHYCQPKIKPTKIKKTKNTQ